MYDVAVSSSDANKLSSSPKAPPKVCKNCGQDDHMVGDCKNARAIDRSAIEDVLPETAYEMLKAACLAVEDKDLDDVKEASQFCDLERVVRC